MIPGRFMALILATAAVGPGRIGVPNALGADAPTRDDLAPWLEPIRQEYRLPGLAAALVRGDKVFAAGAVGVRQVGKEARVELDDRFHIGSCTKSMTAMLIARLVDQGK